jgi:SAM-dependent methyltransferase
MGSYEDELISPWNVNAKGRHEQVLTGKDISFTYILVPAIIDLLLSNNPNGLQLKTVLDVGCGTGIFTYAIARMSKKVKGIDPAINTIEIATDYNVGLENVSFQCVGIEEYAQNSSELYDIVVSNMTFHAIEDIDKAILSASKCVKPNGEMVFSIPHPCFYFLRKKELASPEYKYLEESFRKIPFTISNIEEPLDSYTPFHHRPISRYVSAIKKAGLFITDFREPSPSESVMKMYPSEDVWRYPHFMIVSCIKLQNKEWGVV